MSNEAFVCCHPQIDLRLGLVWYCREVSENSEDQKTNVSERSDVLDRLLMFAGLEKDKHKANFATFMNVIVSHR